jgi:hypothetical protein
MKEVIMAILQRGISGAMDQRLAMGIYDADFFNMKRLVVYSIL